MRFLFSLLLVIFLALGSSVAQAHVPCNPYEQHCMDYPRNAYEAELMYQDYLRHLAEHNRPIHRYPYYPYHNRGYYPHNRGYYPYRGRVGGSIHLHNGRVGATIHIDRILSNRKRHR